MRIFCCTFAFLSLAIVAMAENAGKGASHQNMNACSGLANSVQESVSGIHAARTKREMRDAAATLPIEKIVLLTSGNGGFKLLMMKNGHAVFGGHNGRVRHGNVDLFDYGMLCHFVILAGVLKDDGHEDRREVDSEAVEMRFFVTGKPQKTLRYHYPIRLPGVWNILMIMEGIKSRCKWSVTEEGESSAGMWGEVELDSYTKESIIELEKAIRFPYEKGH
jgi:hypothetical protein